MQNLHVALIVLILLLAGCAGNAGPTTTETMHDDLPGATIRGTITDEARLPIVNATVTLAQLERVARTDANGQYAFLAVPEGTWIVEAVAAGFEMGAIEVEIVDEMPKEANLELVTIATPDLSYYTTAIKNGRIFCGIDWRISVGGPQGPLAACGALYTAGGVNNLDSFAVVFDLSTGNISSVRELVFETEWTPTQTLGSGLRVFWEAYQEITPTYEFTEELRTFTHVEGPSPLWASVDYIDILDNVTGQRPPAEYCAPNGPCRFWGRVFPYASTLGEDAPVDVSTYVDQAYAHYVTEFYVTPAPASFSALPG